MNNVQSIIQSTRAYLCLDCGKCTGTCPLARVDAEYSPRRIVERVVFGEAESVMADPHLWECMTCGLCSTRCPSHVDFQRFIVEMRAEAFGAGERGIYAHDGVLQEVARIQAKTPPDPAKERRLPTWLAEDMRVSESGEYFYFVGCLPIFDVVFAYLEVEVLDVARSAVRLLNRADVVPIVSGAERCCGADLRLAGDTASFRKLAELNTEMIRASGAKKVVFTCAECYSAFKNDYPAVVGPLPFETMHITELLAGTLGAAEGHGAQLTFEPSPGLVTYHDPCRMCRYLGVHEAPRAVLAGVPGLQLVEMEDNRERAMCCGSTAWVNCSGCAKLIQREKLRQARATGAGVMLTTCPKCQIHLACAAQDLDAGQTVEVDDVISWLGRALG